MSGHLASSCIVYYIVFFLELFLRAVKKCVSHTMLFSHTIRLLIDSSHVLNILLFQLSAERNTMMVFMRILYGAKMFASANEHIYIAEI